MSKKYADIKIEFTISFDDDIDLSLEDQAIEAAMMAVDLPPGEAGFELIGKVRDTELPTQTRGGRAA